MRRFLPPGPAAALLVASTLLSGTTPARADGSFPEPRQILLPEGRPEQIILGTNFGLLFSEDSGQTWLFSCEQPLSAYAGQYLLAGGGSHRILASTGNGLVYSDDDSCSWSAAAGTLSDVVPYALAVDPSDEKRVYAIGVLRDDRHSGEAIYVSDDGGLTFGEPVFTAPERSALLTVLVAPSQPSRVYATLFASPENHPILLRSDDSGEHWEVTANLAESLGDNPFELLAIDPDDASKLYARILGPSAETLAISSDGGQSFAQSVSFPGKLKAFLKLASGTILVGGVAGTEGLGYRSRDGAQTFEAWPEAPRVHALAERNGTLYVAAENFWDGYALAESDDEGASLRPLTGFNQVQGVKGCATDLCADTCAYYAGINLWPASVCAAPEAPGETDLPPTAAAGAGAGGSPEAGGQDVPGRPSSAAAAGAEPAGADESPASSGLRSSGGGCACHLLSAPGTSSWPPLLLGLALLAGRRSRRLAKRSAAAS